MKRTKIISIALISLILCGICLLAAGCPEKQEEKYELSLQIICAEIINGYIFGPFVDEWIVTPDMTEINIEREYDGKQYGFRFNSFNIPNHPKWSESWFSVGAGEIVYSTQELYKDNNSQKGAFIQEKGQYRLYINIKSNDEKWIEREVIFNITIK